MAVRAFVFAMVLALAASAAQADDITDAIDQARKSYQAGDMAGAKQSLDIASQLIGQKNAEGFAALLPQPLPGWTGEKPETTSVGVAMLGASTASRRYEKNGKDVEVRITGDSAMVMQFAQLLLNPAIAGAMGKIIKVADQRAIQTREGDVNVVIANKYLVTVTGSADAETKVAYARAVDYGKLSKM